MNTWRTISKLLFLILMVQGIPVVWAQIEPAYSSYQLAPVILNPAYTGSEEVLSVAAIDRRQWTLLDGAPTSQVVAAHSPLKKNNQAVGVLMQRDKIGVTVRSAFSGIYSYRLRINEQQRISFAMQGGFSNLVSRLSELDTRLPDDPAMRNDRVELFTPLLGAGILWNSQRQFAGISVPDFFEPNLRAARFSTINYRNYFLQYGVMVNAGRQIRWVPSVLLKYNKGTQLLADFNSMIVMKETLWLSCSYRHSVSWNFLMQAQITNQLTIGYSYEYPIGIYSAWGGGSHEFKVGYRFELFKSNYYMPRYF